MRQRPRAIEIATRLLRVAARRGEPRTRIEAAQLAVEAEHCATDASRAVAARCAGMVDAGDGERDFAAALASHARAGSSFERARTLLVHGERLHRARRRGRARHALDEAQALFAALDAEPWRARAAAALATASPARRVGPTGPSETLTAQEQRVAALLATGRTVRDAAVELRLSPKTVDSHLRQVYAKLGIRSRAELALVAAERGWLGAAHPPRS